jgi:glycosyltransferase involved in cell wall biosynthesis
MRILLVAHDFLPRHPAGTEIYTLQLGQQLKAAGHEVNVFATEKDISLPNLSIRARSYGGLTVHELTNNLFYNEYGQTWDYPPAARSFGLFLDEFRPDAVHFMHLMYLSVGCVEEAAQRRIPVVYTLHDYWLQCARFGQRRHANGSICHTIEFERCGDCMSRFKFRQTRVERGLAKGIAALRARVGLDLGPLARRVAHGFKARSGAAIAESSAPAADSSDWSSAPDYARGQPTEIAHMTEAVRQRDRALRERLLPVVDEFIAPSRFLRERFLDWGVPPERIRYMRTGIDLSSFAQLPARTIERGQRVRIAFVGTLAPHKGVHVLLRAWNRLEPRLRERGELVVFGPHAHNPDYVRSLEALAARGAARMAGELPRAAVARELARIDLLVVPSVWYENSPLIILEALAARTPLAVSDLGGMAELVEEGESGFHFRVGDERHLAQVLERVLLDPRQLARLYTRDPAIRDVREDARELETLYAQLAARRATSAPPATRAEASAP